MAEPISALASLTTIFQYLRPSRSPYLLATGVATSVLIVFSSEYDEESFSTSILFFIPLAIVLIALYNLTLKYRLSSIDENHDLSVVDDIEDQFKLARATGIAIGCYLLLQINFILPIHSSLLFSISYLAILAYILTFLHQMYKGNKQEEKIERRNIFQVAFTTSLLLFGMSSVAGHVGMSDDSLLYSCWTKYSYETVEYQKDNGEEVDPTLVKTDDSGNYYIEEKVELDADEDWRDLEENDAINSTIIASEGDENFTKNLIERNSQDHDIIIRNCSTKITNAVELIAQERNLDTYETIENPKVVNALNIFDFSVPAYLVFFSLWFFGQIFWMQNSGNPWLTIKTIKLRNMLQLISFLKR